MRQNKNKWTSTFFKACGLVAALGFAGALHAASGMGGAGEASAGAGMDDPLAALAALGDAMADFGPDGGGSVRAKKKDNDPVKARLKDPRNVQVRVEKVSQGAFPLVALRLKVVRAAKTGPGAKLAKNTILTAVPSFGIKEGAVDLSDAASRINAGAYYLRRKDKAMIRLDAEAAGKNGLYRLSYIERK